MHAKDSTQTNVRRLQQNIMPESRQSTSLCSNLKRQGGAMHSQPNSMSGLGSIFILKIEWSFGILCAITNKKKCCFQPIKEKPSFFEETKKKN